MNPAGSWREWRGSGCGPRSRPGQRSAFAHERCLTGLLALIEKALAGCEHHVERGLSLHPGDRRAIRLLLDTCEKARQRAERDIGTMEAGVDRQLVDRQAVSDPAL